MCQTDKELADITNKADMVTMDGQPMRWYANLVHKVGLRDRVCGPELMQRCLAAGVDKGWKHFFLGSTEAVLEGLCKRLSENYPGIKIVGCYSPPFRTLNEEEHQMIVNMINSSNADFLWVGLGAPKQEKWIAKNLHLLHIPVQIGVGAAFDFHSGNIRRAPAILQKYGFEWLYRIIQDPRLLKRYFMTNPVFLFMFFRDYFQARIISSRRLLDKS
jgi:N-acetylglucosaminyldiphosphoundecaprenol N-acetyl-beta-D-mannosaminyltransferase